MAVPAILPDGSIAPESISAIIDATPIEEAERARRPTRTPSPAVPAPDDADEDER